ncbi:MAG: HDOD domain-containing protein [Pseudomonadota bacterium]
MKVVSKEELIKKVSDPRVLPFVAKKVLDIVSNEDASIVEICQVIEKDQTITASVLKIANSVYYGPRQKVTSIRQAIVILGLKALRNIVLLVSTKLQYKRFGITEQLMWDHSIGAAIAARQIAAGRGQELEEIAFLGGLMHDFGKIVMNNECPEAFSEVMQRIYNENDDSLTAEESVFGYNHTDIGAMVVQQWRFPALFVTILQNHHLHLSGLDTIPDPLIAKALACINLADNICKKLGIGYRNSEDILLLQDLNSAVFCGLSGDALDQLVSDTRKTYEAEKAVFQ